MAAPDTRVPREGSSVAVSPTAPVPWPPGARCVPSTTSGQHLPDPSWHRMGESHHKAALWRLPGKKSSRQMVELNSTNSLAFHERLRVGGWTDIPLASTATARDQCLLHSSLFPSLAVRYLAAAPKSNGSILNGEEGESDGGS